MADRKLYDYDGNEIPTTPVKKLYDFEGEPLKFKDPITATSEKVAPIAGRLGVEALPALGSFAGPGGTLIGAGIKQRLKSLKPELFGEQPQGVDAAVDAGVDLLTNNILPWGVGKGLKLATQVGMQGPGAAAALRLSNMPAVRDAAVGRLSQQLNRRLFPETGIVEQGAINTEQTFANAPHLFQQNEIGRKLFNLNNEYTNLATDPVRTQGYRDIANKAMSDVIHVQNAKLVAGPEFTNDLAVNKLLTLAGNPADKTINAAKALDELGGKSAEIYKEAMNPASYDSMKKLLETMQGLQKTNKTDTIMRYADHKLMYMGAGALLHGPGGAIGGLAASSALTITDSVLRKIMANEETAKLVTAALQTPASAPQAGLINKALQVALPRLFQAGADVAATPDR